MQFIDYYVGHKWLLFPYFQLRHNCREVVCNRSEDYI